MTGIKLIRAEFVEAIPRSIEDGVLYVSHEYETAIHKCCCGCGQEVVTPIGPTDWKVTSDGDAISVHPSIGNWSFPCQSHYWIDHGRMRWAERWSAEQIKYGRERDRRAKQIQYGERDTRPGFWSRLWHWLTGR